MLEAKEYNAQFEQNNLPIIDADSIGKSYYNPSTISPDISPLVPTQGESQYDGYIPREEIENPELLLQHRAENQPWYDQAANFLNQAVIGEVIGGTIMSVGAIAGIPELIYNGLTESEDDFSNSIFDAGKAISDWTREVTPIYQTGDRFADSGWWFQNGVSVASTLSMMVPGMAVSKGVQALGKAIQLGTTVTNVAATGLGALTMRHAENYREANDVFKTIYNLGIENGKGEELSLKAASDAAALDYGANYANLAFDVIQLGSVLRPLKNLTRNAGALSGKVAGAADDILSKPIYSPTSKFGKIINRIKDPAKIGLAEWTEGIEEGINTISQFEGIRQGKIDLGLQEDDYTSLPERIVDYLGTSEMQDAMLWGVVGGAAFKGLAIATGFDENAVNTKKKVAEIAGRASRIEHYNKTINAINSGTVLTTKDGEVIADFSKVPAQDRESLVKDTVETMLQDLAFTSSKAGNFDVLLAQVKDSKFAETLEKMGVGTKEEVAKSIPSLMNKLEQYESIYKKHYSNLFESPIDSRAKDVLVDRNASLEAKLFKNNEELKNLSATYNDLLSKDAWYQTNKDIEGVNPALEVTALHFAKMSLETALEENLDKDTKKQVEKSIEEIDNRIRTTVPIAKPINLAAIDKRIISSLGEQIVIQEYNKQLSNYITELSNPENIKKDAKVVVSNLKKVNENLKKAKEASDNAKSKAKEAEAKAKVEAVVTPEEVASTPTNSTVEDFTPQPASEVIQELPVDDSTLDEIMQQTTSPTPTPEKVEESIESKKDKLIKDLETDLREETVGLESARKGDKGIYWTQHKGSRQEWEVDEQVEVEAVSQYGVKFKGVAGWKNFKDDWHRFNNQTKAEEINAFYQDLLSKLPTSEEVSTTTTTNAADNAGYEDGTNTTVPESSIVIEEPESIVIQDKRVPGLAINYLVSKYSVSGAERGKTTVDPKDVDEVGILASEWTELNEGTELTLQVDTGFSGEVDRYVDGKRVRRTDGSYAKDNKTFSELLEEDRLDVPIKITTLRDGKEVVVGYLPTIKWLSAKDDNGNFENLADNEELGVSAQLQIDIVTKVRESITSSNFNNVYKSKINKKGFGRLIIDNKKDSKGKRVYSPISTNMPKLLTSKYFAGDVQPFTIYNKGFKVAPNVQFGANVAISEETRAELEENGSGTVFLMIPTSVPNVFIPSPIKAPVMPKGIAEMSVQAIMATMQGDKAFTDEVFNKFGISLTGEGKVRRLKDFLERFMYFTTIEDVNKTESKVVKIHFDTSTSTIIVNDGKITKILLNTSRSNAMQFEQNLDILEQAISNKLLSIRLSRLNSEDSFPIPVVSEKGKVSFVETTYNEFLSQNINTNLLEVETSKGNPVYTVQPVISFTPPSIEENASSTETTKEIIKPVNNPFLVEEDDELVGIDEIKDRITELFESNPEFQKLTAEEKAKTIEQVTKEHRSIVALKDLAHKLAHRIGGKVEFENNPNADWKGYNQGMTSVLNEAYMTPDTPFHEILAHPIIRAIKNKNVNTKLQIYEGSTFIQVREIDGKNWKSLGTFKTKEDAQTFIKNNSQSQLYQSLLKELETGRGKEVFEQVKRDYDFKLKIPNKYQTDSLDYYINGTKYYKYYPVEGEEVEITKHEYEKNIPENIKYSLEEQQEEAIVTLLGLMAADKLDAKKDANLISKLKELWKQISDFVKQLLRQDSIIIDELPITTTLNDLAEIMAYGNNKIILPGYKVEYSTPLGNKYDTLEEVNNEIRGLADANTEIDLSGVKLKDKNKVDSIDEIKVDNFAGVFEDFIKVSGKWYNQFTYDPNHDYSKDTPVSDREIIAQWNARFDEINEFKVEKGGLEGFIEKNKEYEQSKEIIEQWKKENNIQYDPEEVYSRGQGFYSSIGAYSNLELDLLFQNLLQHIQDNKKAGGEFTISAFTKPIDKRLKHIEGTGDRVRFVIYPKSNHIKWAAPTDVYSGSVWDAHEKVSKDKKSELLGVSFTKAPALRNINEVSPNLADVIDNLSHVHNELGIELTTDNFRIEYDDNIDYSTKKLIDNINKILDDKYGKLVEPNIKKENGKTLQEINQRINIINNTHFTQQTPKMLKELDDLLKEKRGYKQGKQPTQTRENTTSIENVKSKLGINTPNIFRHEDFNIGDIITIEGIKGEYKIYEYEDSEWEIGIGTTEVFYNVEPVDESIIFDPETNPEGTGRPYFRVPTSKMKKVSSVKDKEYTSQAETNLKVAALKEVARKYPRSLITSKVVPINPNLVESSEIQYSKVGSKQDTERFKNFISNPSDELIGESQVETIKSYGNNFLVTDGDYTYTADKQRAITNSISGVLYSSIIKEDAIGKKLSIRAGFAEVKKMLTEAYEYHKSVGTNLNVIAELERILKPEVWKQFEKQIINDLTRLKINIKENSIEDFSDEELAEISESLEEDTVEGNDGQIHKSFDDFATFQLNNKDTASWKVKLALASIRSGKNNTIGLPEILSFDTVFDELQNILSNVDGNINTYIAELRRVSSDNKSKRFLKYVADLLESPDTSWALKNNFVSVMQRANNSFILLKYKKGENGWTLIALDSNRNNVVNKILETWNDNFKNSNLVKSENGELVVNKDKVNELYSEFSNLSTIEDKQQFTKKLFLELGIDMPDAAIQELFTKNLGYIGKNYKVSGSFSEQFSFTKDGKPNGLISAIMYSLSKETDLTNLDQDVEKISFNNPFLGEDSEKSIKFLANLSAKFGLKLDTNTHRNVEGKQIYDYSFYTPERLKVQRLNNDTALRKRLATIPFSSHSKYLTLLDKGNSIEYSHVDGISPLRPGARGVTRGNMSGREQLLLALGHFQKHETNVGYLGLTHSDKSISPIITFVKTAVQVNTQNLDNGRVTKESISTSSIRKEFRNLINAEVSRIKNALDKKASGIMTRDVVGSQYYEGSEYFYFFPELNEIVRENGVINRELLNNSDLLLEAVLDTVVDTINNTIDEFYINGLVYKDSKDNWRVGFNQRYVKDAGYGRKEGESLTATEAQAMAAIAAADLEINYMIHNANMMMLVHGDPALEFKKDIDTTLVEYQKRLAKDVAPGALGHYNWSMVSGENVYGNKRTYNIVIAEDIINPTETEGYIKSLRAYNKSLDRTDAQELTTTSEHLNILMSYGRIPDHIYKSMMDKIVSSKDGNYVFDEEELTFVLQPMKPVQVWSNVDEALGVEKSFYIKSSSFPLIPQLTKGLDLDKIRIAMERDGVDRITFKTAVKIGYKKLSKLSDENGNILSNLSFKENIIQLDREGFSIQQDVPYEKGRHRIVTISQMNKLLFEGITHLTFTMDGKKYSGVELKAYKETIRKKLMELSASELYRRMGITIVDGNPVITDFSKLLESVQEEAISRGWALNDIESLSLNNEGNLIIPFSFNNSSERIEALILSMFTNTIIKQKINGKSLVQGTSSGFKNNVKTLDEISKESGIVFIKGKFDPTKGLTYTVPATDTTKGKRAQVLIPWKFAGKLEDFIGEDGYLDLSKFDRELLDLIGARIPNQGHSSQLAIEVVGFLPESMGDLIIVPGEITKQMGADFDVDKLYTYIYNNVVDNKGRLIIIPNLLDNNGELDNAKYKKFISSHYADALNNRQKVKYFKSKRLVEYEKIGGLLDDVFEEDLDIPADQLIEKEVLKDLGLTFDDLYIPTKNQLYRMSLENEYIKIHNVVLTHPEVAKKSLKELDKDDLKITGTTNVVKRKSKNFLSASRQIEDYARQKAGKDLVGIFSRAVVGAAVIQDYNLRLVRYDSERKDYVDTEFIGFGHTVGGKVIPYKLKKLSGVGTSMFSKETRSKVDNLIIQQSGAVDNAKTPVLDMNHLNMVTSNASIAISLLQDDSGNALNLEYNSYFLRQEIIQDYVTEMANLSDGLNDTFIVDKKKEIIDKLKTKYANRAGIAEDFYNKATKTYTSEDLKNLLLADREKADYVLDQIIILDLFSELDAIGQELSEIFTAISTDSKGLGKNYWNSSLREQQLINIDSKSMVAGASELLENTENGKIAEYVVEANKIMSQLFPYQTEVMNTIITTIEELSGKVGSKIDADFRKTLWENLKMFIVSNPDISIYTDRQEMFYGSNSMYEQLRAIKQTDLGKTNLFIQKLRGVKASKEENPNLVIYSASQAERIDEADLIKAFTDLFINSDPKVREFAENLVKYSYITGGVQKALEFVKYIPVSYIKTIDLFTIVKNVEDSMKDSSNSLIDINRFIQQFLQHNPQYATKLIKDPGNKQYIADKEQDSNLMIEVLTSYGRELVFPDYVSYFNQRNNKWQLYKRTGGTVDTIIYDRINTLGGKGKDLTSYNEYEFSKDDIRSTIDSNNIDSSFKVKEVIQPKPQVDDVVTNPVNNPAVADVQASNYINGKKGVEALNGVFDNLKSKSFKELAKFLKLFSTNITSDLTVSIDNNLKSDLTGEPSRGKFNRKTKEIIINPKNIESAKLNKSSITKLEHGLMHEITHAYTSELYEAYRKGVDLPELTPKVKESFRKLENLREFGWSKLTTEEKVIVSNIASGKVDLIGVNPDGSKNSALRMELIDKYYGFVSVKEFISETMSNSTFQQQLNKMPFGDKSIWDRVSELIKSIFTEIAKNLGFDLSKGSVLESTFLEVMNLIEASNERLSEVVTPKTNGFQGYKGGFENTGKGTPEGDGKDKAMRQVADGFIGEVANKVSSSFTSAVDIGSKIDKDNPISFGEGTKTEPTILSGSENPSIIMLARNSEFAGTPLNSFSKKEIKRSNEQGAEFVVGDMPNVDSQFIDYLQEIGAKFTIYHTGTTSRITVSESKFTPSPEGDKTGELLIGAEDTLGMSVGDFLKTLPKTHRAELRVMIQNKTIKFNCK